MKIAFFGSSLVSAYWNGAATYYRGLLKALSERGFTITFYEPDAYERQQHRDIQDPDWATVRVYEPTQTGVDAALEESRHADLIVKASGVGVFDAYLESSVVSLKNEATLVAFWDVDAPATLTRLDQDEADPFRVLLPSFDVVFTYGGGPRVVNEYERLGARTCVPVYNALDPHTHYPVAPESRFRSSLSFLGNRLPDREERVREFFVRPAASRKSEPFVIGGNGWNPDDFPENVRNLGHVYTRDHNAFYSSARTVLNISRQSMADFGYPPATRVFEAAGAEACLITDAWEGVEEFLEPDREVLVASSGEEVAAHLDQLDEQRARFIGQRARRRVLAEHTYAARALQVERALGVRPSGVRSTSGQVSTVRANRGALVSAPGPGRRSESSSLSIVVLGLSITSSWGNGHATTYRSLIRELSRLGHRVLFLERDTPWYQAERDLPNPGYCAVELYGSVAELKHRFAGAVATADMVIVGSFVPEGIAIGNWVTRTAWGTTAFYDIDTPVTLSQLEQGSCDYISAQLIPRYDLYLSFAGGPTLSTLERTWGARSALPLDRAVDTELYFPERMQPRWDLGYMGTFSDDRQPALERLLLNPAKLWPEGRFAVVGSSYPVDYNWPSSVDYLGHLPPARHREFYSQQRFALNLTRRDMVRAGYSPSVRLFEAAATGVPIVTDRWAGLEQYFEPGAEILVVDRTEDVLDILREMPEAARLEVGRRAHARVLREHSAANRARTLVDYVWHAARPPHEQEPADRVQTAS